MSKQLALSSALSFVMMATVALFAAHADSRSHASHSGQPLIETSARIAR